MFNPSRDEVRQFFRDAHKKQQARLPLSGAELPAADIIARHPEYHALLADAQAAGQEWTPKQGTMNPFLHLSLHLAIAEQLAIDQPPGIRAAFTHLTARMDAHAAEHVLLEALGEVIWAAQQRGTMPDNARYLEKIGQRSG
ncbi:hypothetical protein FACS1894185_1100 [Betaproteobacteria bacterium]|nr:hypothetical protein FACS1894185_1100 [Betaproteobacteria bacterium]